MTKGKEIPKGWEWVKLGDLVLDPKSDLVDGPFGSNLKSNEYTDSGIPVFKIQNIKANCFVEKKFDYVTKEKAETLHRHSFKTGDLIITKLGDPLGLCCKVPPKFKYGIIVADLMRLRPSKIVVSDDYLIYAINSKIVQHQFRTITKGTTRPRVNLTIVREIEIPLPPFSEQHRIVAKLEELFSSLDKGIESLKLAQQQLKVYRQAVLKWAFEGKLTAEWRSQQGELLSAEQLLNHIKDERMEYCKKNKLKAKPISRLADEELADLPELSAGWNWVKIDALSENDKHSIKAGPFGSSLKKEFYVPKGYKIYGQEQVISGDAHFGDYFINETKYNELSSCRVKPYDVLISLVGTIGKVLVLPKNAALGIINPRLIKISINQKFYYPTFFKFYFESSFLKVIYKQKAHGATMDVLNLGIIQELPFPLCSVKEQLQVVSEIESRLSVCDKIEESIEHSLVQAEALRQSILKKAFKGKLVPQNLNDEPARVLLERIKATREKNKPIKNGKVKIEKIKSKKRSKS